MASKSGVVDTSVSKGIADLHAGVMADDPVAAPAHEVVHDSDLIADPSIHADAAPDHGVDTAVTSTVDASADDTGHVHADLAYADADHAYADADHGVADVDHAYADHAYADSIVPDSAVAFVDHPIPLADDGTPHSLGAAQGQGDSHDAAAWWWVGGAALAAGGLGYWAGHDNNDDNHSSSSATTSDVHVVVDRGNDNGVFTHAAWIDTNGDGVHQEDGTEDTPAVFGHGGSADLAANHVTIHFNDVPLEALDLTGFGTDDKIVFHIDPMIDRSIVSNDASTGTFHAQHLTDVAISPDDPAVTYWLASPQGNNGAHFSLHQHPANGVTDFNSITHDALGGYLWANVQTLIWTDSATASGPMNDNAVIAYWSDTDNALNSVSLLLPNTTAINHTAALNANNEGGLVDFIWPSGAQIAV
jgi:hypothetical protein